MAGFAFASGLERAADLELFIDRMARGAAHRGEPRGAVAVDGRAAGAALAEGRGAHVATDQAGRLIVADTRLDDVEGLARRLGDDGRSGNEAALILAAYARWGDDCADQLRGDFAFVIWDAPRSAVFAARDVFGIRPLFYARRADRFLAGSEIAQVLASGVVERAVDERTVLASLIGRTQSPRWTLFSGVRRLPAGHILRSDAQGTRTRPFWSPARRAADRRLTGREYAQELSALLMESVRSRLIATEHPGLLLSGGIDSTSIAATAAGLESEPSVPTLATYSFGYDDFPEADERSVSTAIAEANGLPNQIVPADDAYPLADFGSAIPDLDGPEFLQSYALMRRSFSRARAEGIELMMTGHRGDALFGEGIFDYLGVLGTGGPAALWRQLGQQARHEQTTTRAVLKRDVLRRLPAAAWPRYRATRLRDWVRRAAPGGWSGPPWIRGEAVRTHGLEQPAPDAVPVSTLRSDARRRRHEALIQPSHGSSAEYLERLCAQAGLRYTDPWSDRRIADWLLEVPPSRITVEGTNKWVLREATRGLLPESARDGSFLAHPTSFYQHGVITGGAAAVESLLEDSVTAQRGLVDPVELRRCYEHYQSGVWPGIIEWNAFWRWVSTERWLRSRKEA